MLYGVGVPVMVAALVDEGKGLFVAVGCWVCVAVGVDVGLFVGVPEGVEVGLLVGSGMLKAMPLIMLLMYALFGSSWPDAW